ncbi:unnamed protein product [Rotaria sordida]|uniref:TLC domain-containing protein n=1 Tax=Rotaria sordida TaxID=392033 RepID=A0A815QLX8_9BILA|nr:unnamed protein product [Rotaria sordida]
MFVPNLSILYYRLSSVVYSYIDLGTNPSSDVPISLLIIISIAFNSFIFFFLPSSITPLIKSYIVSTIHACVSVLAVCIFYLYSTVNLTQVNRILGGGIKGTNDEMITYSVCYSAGYFIYDIIIMLLFKSIRSSSALVHHVLLTAGTTSG